MEPLLLVEDKNELRAMLRKALERAGYDVDEAPDGAAAIQKLRARRYLLVITDLKMPGASGLDVLRETKQADATIPVLLLTAYGSVEEAVAAMKEGAFDFLQKPVDLDHLKLLVQRALEEKRVERVGGTQSIDVDVRIVVATNRNLQKLTEEKLFREDLYFRISAVPMTIPPLRERGNDVLLLADDFLEKFSREFGKTGLELSEEARDRLLHYRWPGNVRELQNTLERAVILANGTSIRADGLQLPAAKPDAESLPAGMLPEKFNWEGSLEEVTGLAASHVEKGMLENTMRECKWNKTRAAEKLGVSPKTLLAKLRGAGLEE